MKYFYLFLFLTTNFIVAQDARLFENTWYLSKIVSSGIDYYPPTISQVSSIRLTFGKQNNTIDTNVCNSFFGNVVFGNNQTDFTLTYLAGTLIICNLQSDGAYENLYQSFFRENNSSSNFFTYTITSSSASKTLTINSASNKQAIYTNQNLSTIDFKELGFNIYSDASANFIVVELKKISTNNVSVEIFDSLGKKLKSKSFYSNEFKISTEDLSNGVYVVKVTSENQVGIKKFIKS